MEAETTIDDTVYVQLGNDVNLTCPVTGNSTSVKSVRWSRSVNSQVIAEAFYGSKGDLQSSLYISEIKYNIKALHILTIKDVDISDETVYMCTVSQATNTGTSQENHSIQLTICAPFDLQMQVKNITYGHLHYDTNSTDVTIRCQTYLGRPVSNIVWYLNSNLVSENKGIDVQTSVSQEGYFYNCTSMLRIRRFTEIHVGNYTCIANNKCSELSVRKSFTLLLNSQELLSPIYQVSSQWTTQGADYYGNTTYESVQVTTLNVSTYSIPPPTAMIFVVIFIAVVALLFIVTVVACIICGILRMSSRRIKVKTTNQSWIYTTDTADLYTKVDANDSHRGTTGTRRKQRTNHVKVNSETYPHESEVLDVELPPDIPLRNWSDSDRGTNGTRRKQRVSVGKSAKFHTRRQNGKSRNSRIDNVKRNKHIITKVSPRSNNNAILCLCNRLTQLT
ncbi:uncharacterized protein LOC144451459 isoform X2 [Glandiceps talaboti]